MSLPSFKIDTSWTLFLDRDGVINVKRDNDYVKNWGEFIFLEGVLEALPIFAEKFGRIIVVTNQRGVGRKLMSIEDLEDVHRRMLEKIEGAGGRIDQIFYCPDLAENDTRGWRKPKAGMAFAAQEMFGEIEFQKSLIIGDSISDMEFGKNAGMHTVWLSNKDMALEHKSLIDAKIETLIQYAQHLKASVNQEA
ncbi:MAG: HAD family hydrolase [Bacteroidota bacterium]